MRKFVRLYNGMRIQGVYCAFCDLRRDGKVLREDIYWKKMLDCGHKVGRSFVLPPSELIRLGYVNQEFERDPRAIAQINSVIEDGRRAFEQRKRQRWIRDNLAGGKRYM